MTLRQKSAPPLAGFPRAESATTSRLPGLLLAALGVLFIALSVPDLASGTVLGGREDETLRGDTLDDALVALAGHDALWGLGGRDLLSGGPGDDELYGGAGADVLLGGAGADFVEAADGEPDRILCGPGEDVVSADPQDRLAPDCETVYRG
ncbi:hypothetical protein Rxycam_02367 [Rubrobacter xylanophilus DSM 9941]|uniref:calcium-binding protein n=1 Tax=Rubrobacter xylanophilus TaxID=49319 RepID=UPI001C63BD1E|nr:calcium-binding protein [Rubrobacter xylanophilus]QYJ16534.1 hypothetical protein Rxycam_02367 [Rubrobacter xylanophilus DSM 9941]